MSSKPMFNFLAKGGDDKRDFSPGPDPFAKLLSLVKTIIAKVEDKKDDRDEKGGKDDRDDKGGKDRDEKGGKNDRDEKSGKDDRDDKSGKDDRDEKGGKDDRDDKHGKDDRDDKGGKDDRDDKHGKDDRDDKDDHHGGCICFMAGTRIATPTGAAVIEDLVAGDLVTLSGGGTAPIRWVGRQTIDLAKADPLRVLPVRIPAGALGHSLPNRDLLVSPDHALLLDGVLVHAGALVDGDLIRRETAVPTSFTYYHIELADHSLILAEDVAAETYVDNADTLAFDNWAERDAIADGAPLGEMALPRAKSRRQLPASLRARLEPAVAA